MPEVFVGLGSNIEPERHLRWALAALERRFGPVRRSDVYRSPPFGFDGPDFLNLVVAFGATAGIEAIEAALSELESSRGRDGRQRAGSRTLDLDLLLYGARVDARQRLPRADVLRYPFVLVPLADLAPELVHPVTGVAIGAAREAAAAGALELRRVAALDAA